MFQREWIRLGAVAAVGLIIGILWSITSQIITPALVMPFYAIGTVYGIRVIIKLIGEISKAGLFGLMINPGGCLITLLLIVIGFSAVLSFGWIVGLGFAVKALVDAYSTDKLLSGRQDHYDRW